MSTYAFRNLHPVPDTQRTQIAPNGVLGMLIFVVTEAMLFAGLISAFTIVRASALVWPPLDQPRLPLEETAVNTVALLLSGVTLYIARRVYRRDPQRAKGWLLTSMLLGGFFVVFQGFEWASMLGQGLTLTSSTLGSFFYLIVGMHALHAVVAIGILGYAWLRLQRGWLPPGVFGAAEVFWYFVIGVWPVLYLRVYL